MTARLFELLEPARRVLVFTGAGISTASGIPDFRGPNGAWTRHRPVYYQEFVASEAARLEYWRFKSESYRSFRDARPNRVHLAIARLETLGRVAAVVTQNVDGLHRVAGSTRERLIELHGTNAEAECIECGARSPIDGSVEAFDRGGTPPRCACGGLLKPAVVMFGQALDGAALRRAAEASERADLILALGSSLVVTPAAEIPLVGARRGTPYVIVNRGSTPHDGLATLCLDADVSEVVPAAVDELERRLAAAL